MEGVETAIQNLAIDVDAVSEHSLISAAQVSNETLLLTHFENPNAPNDSYPQSGCELTRSVFIQHGEIRRKFLRQKNRCKLASSQPKALFPFLETHSVG